MTNEYPAYVSQPVIGAFAAVFHGRMFPCDSHKEASMLAEAINDSWREGYEKARSEMRDAMGLA